MAKLHEYTSESDFSGYYIYGVLHQKGHTTIQVSPTAKRLFDYIEMALLKSFTTDTRGAVNTERECGTTRRVIW